MNFLETEDVVKQYANHLALDKVSIQVPEGKVFGLLGPNRSRQNHTDPYHQPHHGPRQRPWSVLTDVNFSRKISTRSVTCRKNAACIKK